VTLASVSMYVECAGDNDRRTGVRQRSTRTFGVSRARVSGRRRTPAATRAPKQALDELAAALANGSDRRRFLGGNVWRLLKISKSASIGQ